MATASVPNDFVSGEVIVDSDFDANFQALVDFANNNTVHRDGSTALTGALTLSGAPTNALHAATKAYVDAATLPGAYTGYTPTLTQGGTVTKTVTRARHHKVGRDTTVRVYLDITGAGVSGSIVVGLPFASAFADGEVIGSGFVHDASAGATYNGNIVQTSTTTVTFARTDAPIVGGGRIGADPVLVLANGDVITFTASFEAAS